ncbi:uncharacterized protein LOC113491623 isoform X2 [Trichoplusia ni]|uniref:Uncharacterized protein LOC113491623 isoform X2 n=1 Tax=Trichoplusia ni TaxID=7111 RepID=A0A7E5V876_TRINI|nr:uncharacterized protein LOC113491623 isoform X2 [Trichoplusia ni]
MEKPKITKKIRTIQITYPAPYSQTWNAEHNSSSPVIMKNNFGRRSNFLFNPKRQVETQKAWSHSYSAVRGPDPTAPHLKYGVFSNRRSTSTRLLQKSLPLKPTQNRNSYSHNTIPTRQASDYTNNKNAKKKKDRKGPLTEAPMFVFRTIDKRHTRQLSLSEIMHIDIKPKKSMLSSPRFCPSPTFKVLTPNVPAPTVPVQLNARAAQTH